MAAEDEFRAFLPVGTPTQNIKGADLASAATMAPTHYLHLVSGTTEITLITLPYTGFAGTIAFRPTGAFTGATSGTATALNKKIGLAFTAVTGKILFLTYDPVSELWYPSYTS